MCICRRSAYRTNTLRYNIRHIVPNVRHPFSAWSFWQFSYVVYFHHLSITTLVQISTTQRIAYISILGRFSTSSDTCAAGYCQPDCTTRLIKCIFSFSFPAYAIVWLFSIFIFFTVIAAKVSSHTAILQQILSEASTPSCVRINRSSSLQQICWMHKH